MKQYFKRFRFLYIAIAILLVAYLVTFGIHSMSGKGANSTKDGIARTNKECTTDERVFDYGEKLTDNEEQSLRDMIEEKEKKIHCDIIVVTLDEPVNMKIRDWADQFVEDNKFGYDRPYGDSVIFVANWDQSSYDNATFETSGRAEDQYSTNMIDYMLDSVKKNLRNDPCQAFETYIDNVYYDMSDSPSDYRIPGLFVFGIALVITIIYLVVNLASHKGKKTTNASTYVEGGVPDLKRKDDVFVTKNVVSRKIETNSGGNSGGGGHHVSSGGHSHGGGSTHF